MVIMDNREVGILMLINVNRNIRWMDLIYMIVGRCWDFFVNIC